MKYRKALDDALTAYLEEFGGEEGGDATTFVDFVVSQLHGPLDNAGLCGWYQGRADALDAEMEAARKRLDARTEGRRRALVQQLRPFVAERGKRSLSVFFRDAFAGWLSRMAHEAVLERCAEAEQRAKDEQPTGGEGGSKAQSEDEKQDEGQEEERG